MQETSDGLQEEVGVGRQWGATFRKDATRDGGIAKDHGSREHASISILPDLCDMGVYGGPRRQGGRVEIGSTRELSLAVSDREVSALAQSICEAHPERR